MNNSKKCINIVDLGILYLITSKKIEKMSIYAFKTPKKSQFFGDNFSETDCICKFSTIFTKTNLEWSIGINFGCQFIPTDFLEAFKVRAFMFLRAISLVTPHYFLSWRLTSKPSKKSVGMNWHSKSIPIDHSRLVLVKIVENLHIQSVSEKLSPKKLAFSPYFEGINDNFRGFW